MTALAYLPPVGPFAGVSKCARQQIRECYPALPIEEVEKVIERFVTDLQTDADNRLIETRHELNILASEIARAQCAVRRVRHKRLDDALDQAGQLFCGSPSLAQLERSLTILKKSVSVLTRCVPVGRDQFASRMLVARLAEIIEKADFCSPDEPSDALLVLSNLIFDDLMVGGDATKAVSDWRISQPSNGAFTVYDPAGMCIETLVKSEETIGRVTDSRVEAPVS